MMMHTPGPWHANPDDSLHRVGVYAGDGDEIIICDVTDEDVQENHEVMAANARLIAAAPELLEYLETLRGIATDDAPGACNGALIELQSDYCAEIIAKATKSVTPTPSR